MDNTVSDLVVSAMEQNPLDFENTFNSLIVDRLQDMIMDRKISIAQQMYNYMPPANDNEEQDEYQDDGQGEHDEYEEVEDDQNLDDDYQGE